MQRRFTCLSCGHRFARVGGLAAGSENLNEYECPACGGQTACQEPSWFDKVKNWLLLYNCA